MISRKRLQLIQSAVEKASGCKAEHLESALVTETFRGEVVWEGVVEVFTLVGHAKAKHAYGWAFQDEEERFVTVLELPPVVSPETAVRAAIAAGGQK
ncbi:hypothetical protein BH09VER1_BH09VER1_25930 [soil metagenome]